jgi:Flp pilus assembly protein TadD
MEAGSLRRWAATAVLAAAALMGCAAPGPTPQQVEQQALLANGERLEAAGASDEALLQYVRLLGSDPENVEAHFRIGRVHSTLGNTATARDAFQRALAKEPKHVGALEGLGLLYLEANQPELGASALHKALAQDGKRWRSYNGLGVLADLSGKHGLAQAYFESALKLRPGDAMIMNNLGYSMYLGGRVRDAQKRFEQVLVTDPANQKALSNLGLVLTRQGHYHRAIETLEKIMTPAEARYSIGSICLMEGRLEDAERMLRDSIRRSPNYDPAAHAALKRTREEMKRRARIGDEEDDE